jgi:predicted AAA+ superfamily ATPase
MKHIERISYLDKLKKLNNTPDIKVITGIRRSGKSVLMQDYIEYILTNEPDANVIMINLQDLEYDNLLDYHALHEYVLSKYIKNVHNLVFIDEVQLCNKFELAINSLHSKAIFDIYITGSNAFLLSSDLATLFTGRVMQIKVYPFSFSEYMDYNGNLENVDAAFEAYSIYGGMPGSYVYGEKEQKQDYVKEVYRTIIIRDLVNKYKIRNETEFKNMAEFMMDNIGNLLSPNNVCNCLNNSKSSVTRKTVSRYIEYLCNAFLFYEAKRYDLKGKKYLENNCKYYLSDTSFRFAINGTKNMNYGHVYENIVYLELLRRGYEVYVGKLYKKEIDFVAKKGDEVIYIQVSDYIGEEKTFEREYTPLLAIKDAYTKIIIARTHHEMYKYEGILIYDIARWLLDA